MRWVKGKKKIKKKREKQSESRDKAKHCGDEILRLRIYEIGAVFKE